MSNNVKSRIQMKNDTSANWKTAGDNGFVPLKGEIIFYTDLLRFKVGDNAPNINNLSFYDRMISVSNTEPDFSQEGDIWIDTTETTTLYTAEEASF